MAAVAKALGDPIRLQLVDVLRKHAGKVCVCELVPLFDISQPTLSPPPQEAARGRHRRLRAPRAVGLLLRHPRRAGGADRMAELTENTDIREHVRERYAAAANARRRRPPRSWLRPEPRPRSSCCGRRHAHRPTPTATRSSAPRSTATRATRRRQAAAVEASLGCGVPTAVADLHEGETVLDLGSGAGADVLISARRVGPTGTRDRPRHDRRDARRSPARNAAEAGVDATSSSSRATSRTSRSPTTRVDVVISNCVINLSADKPQVLARGRPRPEARRPLRRLRRDRRPRHGRRHPRRHAAVDRLHRRRAHRARVRGGAHRRRPDRHRDPPDPPRPRARGSAIVRARKP